MKKHGLEKSKEHVDRLKMELEDIKVAWDSNKMDFATYFLMVWQGVNYAKKNNIIVGPGRGSGYASLLLKVLDVTYGLDPVKFGLLWERFLGFSDLKFISEEDLGIKAVPTSPGRITGVS
jgi:DNA polymerase-3 subunit alpha